jgi:hypothetical protein
VINAALVMLALAAMGLTASMAVSRRRDPPPPAPMTTRELEVAIRRAEVTPEALAAMGLTGAETTALIDRARASLSGSIADYRAATLAVGPARTTSDRLERLVRSGLGSEQDASGLVTARATLDSATTAIEGQHAGVRAEAMGENFPPDRALTLSTIVSNKAWSTIPVEYRCRSGATEAEWVALREALFEQRSAAQEDRSVDERAQAVLNDWAEDPAVSAAKINLQARFTEVTTAWNLALH